MGEQIIEQSLIIETRRGLVILTGCAHPGIESIVEKAVKEKGDEILLAMGGFHLHKTDARSVKSIAASFYNRNIRYVGPTHCSGDDTLQIFKQVFGNHYIQAGAGKVIRTMDLA
jgi:7,8-dihydropterin-6-yl-methyl-4-(beta-D-ribofuranosyl)aminobenzene 5'-phosphate synthase